MPPADLDESALLARVREGDADALNDLITLYTPYARAAAERVTLPRPWGYHEALEYALRAVERAAKRYRPDIGNFTGYAAQQIGYSLLTCIRDYSRPSRTVAAAEGEEPESLLIRLADTRRHPAEQEAALDAILAPLNAFHRHLVRRIAVEECSASELARELGIGRHAVAAHYNRAMDILRSRTTR